MCISLILYNKVLRRPISIHECVKSELGRKMEKDKVIVDRTTIPRCKWCGTFYSPHWLHERIGNTVYCSKECYLAATWNPQFEGLLTREIFILQWITLIVWIAIMALLPFDLRIWFLGLLVILLILISSYDRKNRDKLGLKYQSRKDMYRHTNVTQLECPFCSHMNLPDILDCQHCGASLKDAKFIEGDVPTWFQEDARHHLSMCPHCGASYVYRDTEGRGTVNCQNCLKPFSIKKPM